MKHVILGTAGHIDHGKSTLVKALTGIDPDRLKEEKQRGITIDLGFAYLKYPDGITVGIVDVPGHEKLVRNMLAGAGGIDFVLLVVAADEGVMPQTREHLAICNLLGIKTGLVTITKADLVEEELLELVTEDVKDLLKGTFLEGAEVIPVSAKTGLNLDLLKEKIHEIASQVEPKAQEGPFRLPIDRVFTLKGFGTVVTGTAITGSIDIDSQVEILPTGKRARVRGLQSHGVPVQKGFAGQRLAINLQGVDKEDIQRGDILLTEGYFMPTTTIEVYLKWLPDAPEIKSNTPVHVHLFTKEAIGRLLLYDTEIIRPGQTAFGVLKLDRPVVASSGDRFVLRRFSPVETIGGGLVLDPYPGRRRKREGIEDLKALLEKGPEERIS
ncbi:MAG: selenocysteine-specific translation elongation factor, partial [Nitrospirae bacterium]